jgi:hypothetical protein
MFKEGTARPPATLAHMGFAIKSELTHSVLISLRSSYVKTRGIVLWSSADLLPFSYFHLDLPYLPHERKGPSSVGRIFLMM